MVTTAQRKLVVAEFELANAEERKQAEIERAVSAAPVRAGGGDAAILRSFFANKGLKLLCAELRQGAFYKAILRL